MSEPETYLFQASIGPVQSFIASARRTRDLWFGSWLLSELSKAAAQAVVENQGDLIFPANLQAEHIANKIVASISREPRQVGDEVKAAVKARLDAIWERVRHKITATLTDESAAKEQIAALVECVWAAVPLGDDYAESRRRLEALLAARKATRDFGPATWGDEVPKSSISGQLESVIPEDRYPRPVRQQQNKELQKKLEQERDDKIVALWQNYGAGQAERLSAVDLLKRHGNVGQQDRFLSTSHVAALPFLVGLRERANAEKLRPIWHSYLVELEQQHIEVEHLPETLVPPHALIDNCDGAMLFEERLDAQVADVACLKQAKEYLRTFLRECGARPSPYYAILHADGDGMGAVIDHEAKDGRERHREISQQLDSFASDAAQLVRRHAGAPIYTGGDDVLALLPLHTALQCAKELADSFKQFLGDFADDKERKPTLSVGMAVVHHLTPLSDALDLAREAEKVAKRVKVKSSDDKVHEKNALAIIVSKRSGGETTVCGRWGDFDQQLEQLVDLRDDIANGAAYELRDLAERMRDALPAEALRLEALRILKRKQISATALEQLKQILDHRLPNSVEHPDQQLASFADSLIVARLFADARELAKWKEQPA